MKSWIWGIVAATGVVSMYLLYTRKAKAATGLVGRIAPTVDPIAEVNAWIANYEPVAGMEGDEAFFRSMPLRHLVEAIRAGNVTMAQVRAQGWHTDLVGIVQAFIDYDLPTNVHPDVALEMFRQQQPSREQRAATVYDAETGGRRIADAIPPSATIVEPRRQARPRTTTTKRAVTSNVTQAALSAMRGMAGPSYTGLFG